MVKNDVECSDFAAKKKKTKKDKKAEMDELKQELEMDEHRVPIDELYARLGTNPETVSMNVFNRGGIKEEKVSSEFRK